MTVHAQNHIYLTIADKVMKATLVDNQATEALLSRLSASPVTVAMNDYGGFEKVGELPEPLPASDTRITTVPGDIMLYQGDNIVIFYGPNTWSYTPLGIIEGVTTDEIRQFLGSGSVSLTLSLKPLAGVGESITDSDTHYDEVYDLDGRPVTTRPLSNGVYIVNGQKVLIRR